MCCFSRFDRFIDVVYLGAYSRYCMLFGLRLGVSESRLPCLSSLRQVPELCVLLQSGLNSGGHDRTSSNHTFAISHSAVSQQHGDHLELKY
jgi:hypothetical protein